MFKKLADKLFRDKDGRIAVLQMPNAPLMTWGAAMLATWLLPTGNWRKGSTYAAIVALVIWAALEIYSGSSLFRRLVGAAVLFAVAYNRL